MGKLVNSYKKATGGSVKRTIIITDPVEYKKRKRSFNDSLAVYNKYANKEEWIGGENKLVFNNPDDEKQYKNLNRKRDFLFNAEMDEQDKLLKNPNFRKLSNDQQTTALNSISKKYVKQGSKDISDRIQYLSMVNNTVVGAKYIPKWFDNKKLVERGIKPISWDTTKEDIANVSYVSKQGKYGDVIDKVVSSNKGKTVTKYSPNFKPPEEAVKFIPAIPAVTPVISAPVVQPPVARVPRTGERIVPDNKMGNGYPNVDNVYTNGRLDSIQNQAGDRLKYGSKFSKEWQYKGVTPTTKLGNGGSAPIQGSINLPEVTVSGKRMTASEAEISKRARRLTDSYKAQNEPWSADQWARVSQATGDKFRLFPGSTDSFFDNWINPLVMYGNMVSSLGEIPKDIKDGNYGKAALKTLAPVVLGAAEAYVGPYIDKGVKKVSAAVSNKIPTAIKSIPQAKNVREVVGTFAGIPTERSLPRMSAEELKTFRKIQEIGRMGATDKSLSDRYKYALEQNLPEEHLQKVFGRSKSQIESAITPGEPLANSTHYGRIDLGSIDLRRTPRGRAAGESLPGQEIPGTTGIPTGEQLLDNGVSRDEALREYIQRNSRGLDLTNRLLAERDARAGSDHFNNIISNVLTPQNSRYQGMTMKQTLHDDIRRFVDVNNTGVRNYVDNTVQKVNDKFKSIPSEYPYFKGPVAQNVPSLFLKGDGSLKKVADKVATQQTIGINSGNVFTGSLNTSHNSYLPQLKQVFKYQEGSPQFLGYKRMNDAGFLSDFGYSDKDIAKYLNTEIDEQVKRGVVPKNILRPYSTGDERSKVLLPHYGIKQFKNGGSINTTDMKYTLTNKYKRRMDDGGLGLTPEQIAAKKEKFNTGLGTALGIGSEVAPMLVNSTPNEFGVDKQAGLKGALSMGMKLGSAGAAFGPWGAAAGAVVGAGIGVFQANKEQKAATRLETETKLATDRMNRTRTSNQYKSFIAGNPNFEKGSLTSSYYKYGGSATKAAGGAVKFEGPSHQQGGINIGNGIEVEGKETMQDGFVFSDKLGFSSMHKKFLNTLDILDKKPASRAVANSVNATHKKIEDLKVAQEAYKSSLDIPNDFDGTSGNLLSKKEFGIGGNTSHGLNMPKITNVNPEDEAARAQLQYMKGNNPGSIDYGSNIPSTTATDPSVYTDEDRARVKLQYMKENNPGSMVPGQEDVPTIGSVIPQAKLAAKYLLDLGSYGATKADAKPSGTFDTSGVKKPESKIGKNLANTFMNAAPYISNLVNAQNIKKIPMPNEPMLQSIVQGPQVNFSNQIEEAKRNELLGTKLAEKYISSGASIAAVAAAGSSSRVQSVAKIMEAESNTNAGLSLETNKLNAVIESNNNALVNTYNADRVSRQMKKLELSSDNMANASEKLTGQIKDANSKKSDKMKFAIALANDTDGSAWRAMKGVASEYFNAEEIAAYEEVAKVRRERAEKYAKMIEGTSARTAVKTAVDKTPVTVTTEKLKESTTDKKESGKPADKTKAPVGTKASDKAVPGTPAGTKAKPTVPAKKTTPKGPLVTSLDNSRVKRVRPTNDPDKVASYEEARAALAADDARISKNRASGNYTPTLNKVERTEYETRAKLYKQVYDRYADMVKAQRKKEEDAKKYNRQTK